MKPAAGWLIVAALCLTAAAFCGASDGAISNHLYWGQILQGRVYEDPGVATPVYLFLLELETDARVECVEFITPVGYLDVIPGDEYTVYDDVETYHWVYDSTHVWEYWGFFTEAGVLGLYGDGVYMLILHYTDGSSEVTTVWYGVPETLAPIAQPVQRPRLTWPPNAGAIASPMTLTWEPVTDLAVADIYLGVTDANGEYVISDVYGWDAAGSDSYSLDEGQYGIEFSLENFYASTNPDGVPFDLAKTSALLQWFEVVESTAYRFWSPLTGRHFYTISASEKNKLIDIYSHVWVFEGEAFYVWATEYYSGLAPVYRFWSSLASSHFYTISEAEKDKLITDYSHVWTYEGVAFYAFPEGSQPFDAAPVWRFWKASDNTHFYTVDGLEAQKLLTAYSHIYTFEGIAYYAYD